MPVREHRFTFSRLEKGIRLAHLGSLGHHRGRAALLGHTRPVTDGDLSRATEKGLESAIDKLDVYTAPREPQPDATAVIPPPPVLGPVPSGFSSRVMSEGVT